jgi:hypothetical protein
MQFRVLFAAGMLVAMHTPALAASHDLARQP